MVLVSDGAVVESGIDEEFGGDVFVEVERERVLPLPLSTFEGSEPIHACLVRDVVGDGPLELYGELRTEIVQHMLSLIKTISP